MASEERAFWFQQCAEHRWQAACWGVFFVHFGPATHKEFTVDSAVLAVRRNRGKNNGVGYDGGMSDADKRTDADLAARWKGKFEPSMKFLAQYSISRDSAFSHSDMSRDNYKIITKVPRIAYSDSNWRGEIDILKIICIG